MSFVDAVKDLAQQVGMQVPEDEARPQSASARRAQKQRRVTLTDVLARPPSTIASSSRRARAPSTT